ncbi:DarT ssDNA thymidine ADP-ribosyltransferase family protein [Bradyrhizobium sp. LjRoot220]|uniref:DarT ssDNA thymidine ADP-ribosyltransferase family protein n=1 Tax=Bradyrhizobium sp. LjRoot220 TaxID=3342284 RepID=UPI003ECFA17B
MDLDHFLTETVAKSVQHRKFYHFTDRKNLPLIRQHGLLSTKELKRLGLFNGIKTGGDANSLASDHAKGTDDYVCLCFTSSHPMVHTAMNDERKLDPVYLEIHPNVIKLPNVMITNAPSNQAGIVRVPAATALDQLDLEVIYTRTDWSNADIQSRLQKAEKYEILIPTGLVIQHIIGGL